MIVTTSRTNSLRQFRRNPLNHCRQPSVYSFATFARRYEQAASSQESPGSSSHEHGKQKRGGSYTGALAVFAASIPIGWMLHVFQDSKRDAHAIAKPTDFVKYALVNKEEVSSTSSIFTLRPTTKSAIDTSGLHDRPAITSVQVKQPQLQIARSYTTLPSVAGQDEDELRFLVRREHKGEVSGYLHRLPLGAEVELRGPNVEYVLPKDVKEMVFLAGGTGIAPALQVADKLTTKAGVHILWASRRREDCMGAVSDRPYSTPNSSWNFFGWWSPFGLPSPDMGNASSREGVQSNAVVSQIEGLRERPRASESSSLVVDYYIDEEGTFIQPSEVAKLVSGVILTEHGDRILFVSGPEGFVKHWAGPKQWIGGQEVQGPLGGVLSTLNLRGWQVVKL